LNIILIGGRLEVKLHLPPESEGAIMPPVIYP
jgi:hypothetical protein